MPDKSKRFFIVTIPPSTILVMFLVKHRKRGGRGYYTGYYYSDYSNNDNGGNSDSGFGGGSFDGGGFSGGW
jgi:hypothetical protein